MTSLVFWCVTVPLVVMIYLLCEISSNLASLCISVRKAEADISDIEVSIRNIERAHEEIS